MNWDRIEGNWKQVKGGIRQLCGELTGNQFGVIAGQCASRAGRHQAAYGMAKERAARPFVEWQEQRE
jgi:uncharacterized protein YjbJ (UPF0337 family)